MFQIIKGELVNHFPVFLRRSYSIINSHFFPQMLYSCPRMGHFQEMRLSVYKKNDYFQLMYIDYVDEYRSVLTMIKTW